MNEKRWQYVTDEDYETAKNNSIDRTVVERRFYGLGWDVDKAITTPVQHSKKHSYTKEERGIMKDNGISYNVAKYRMEVMGMSKADAISLPKEPGKNASRKRKLFNDRERALMEQNQIPYRTAWRRLKVYNWDKERAVTEPVITNEESLQRAREKSTWTDTHKLFWIGRKVQ